MSFFAVEERRQDNRFLQLKSVFKLSCQNDFEAIPGQFCGFFRCRCAPTVSGNENATILDPRSWFARHVKCIV